MNLKAVLGIILGVIIVIFSLQNIEITDVNFLFWKLSISRVLIIMGSFLIGILVGVLITKKKQFKAKEKTQLKT